MLSNVWKFASSRNSRLIFGIGLILLAIALYAYERTKVDTLNLRLEQATREASDYSIAISALPRTPETIKEFEQLQSARERLEASQLELLGVHHEFILGAFLCVIIGSAPILLEYLEPSTKTPGGRPDLPNDESRTDGNETTGPSNRSWESVAENIEAAEDQERQREIAILSLFHGTHDRLAAELRRLERRSNLNLVFGVVISAAACAVLVYLISREHPEFNGTAGVLAFYLPRITTTALIETIAYFFLRLYRETLAEIKFYQNQRTSLTSFEVAWRVSPWPDSTQITSVVVAQLMNFDPNKRSLQIPESKTDSDQTTELTKLLLNTIADSIKSK